MPRPKTHLSSPSPKARALLALRKAQSNQNKPQSTHAIPTALRKENYPLSFAQQRLWFLHQTQSSQVAYNICRAYMFEGLLNTGVLRDSLNEIIRRHEALRTTFANSNGNVTQSIALPADAVLSIKNLGHLSESQTNVQIDQFLNQETLHRFDLSKGPLYRFTLLRTEEDRNILIVLIHHVVSDEWSMDIFFKELSMIYSAFSASQVPSLPDLPIQYADFAKWQRQRLQGNVLKHRLSYWKDQLRDLSPLELPTDHARPSEYTYKGRRAHIRLSTEVTNSLRKISQQNRCTLFMTLLAGFNILLQRYTGQNDICVGVPIANRNRAETENLIGFFVNSLVIRTILTPDSTFELLLQNVRETTLTAYAHQDLPFERLVLEINPSRDISRNPLFQVFFNMLDMQKDRVNGPISRFSLDTFTMPNRDYSKFDLSLQVASKKDRTHLTMIYNIRLFEHDTTTMMLDHFANLLTDIALNPKKRISELGLLATSDIRHISKTAQNHLPREQSIANTKLNTPSSLAVRFEQLTKMQPQAPAIRTKTETCTYAQLNWQANCIAHTLLETRGILHENTALLLAHDAVMVAAMLGVLKANKAYVPLEPSHPPKRLHSLVQMVEAKVILTANQYLDTAQQSRTSDMQIICVDDLPIGQAAVNPGIMIDPGSAAYLICTSGSTGEPKAVVQSHKNALYHMSNYIRGVGIQGDDAVVCLASYAFDAAFMDIFGALGSGATLNLYDIKKDGLNTNLLDLIDKEITIFHTSPTIFRSLLDTVNSPRCFERVRKVVLGGEEVTTKDVQLYRQHFGLGSTLINTYGPTEFTTVTQYHIDSKTGVPRHRVPIGHSVPDAEVLLLDENGNDSQVYGEIAIRSPYTFPGYWKRPLLTQQVLIADPQNDKLSIYRTGDIGRRLPDGSIEYWGRKDQQIKIRGFRVEPAEIEAALKRHSKITECVVRVTPGEHEVDLVAYYVSDESLSSLLLRRFLRENLPDTMIPKHFFQVDDIPVRPNGKTDYDALSALAVKKTTIQQNCKEPVTPLERLIADIWKRLLGIQQIPRSYTFFDAGGHSLLALRLQECIKRQCGVEVSFRDLLYQTLVQLSHTCQQARQGKTA